MGGCACIDDVTMQLQVQAELVDHDAVDDLAPQQRLNYHQLLRLHRFHTR